MDERNDDPPRIPRDDLRAALAAARIAAARLYDALPPSVEGMRRYRQLDAALTEIGAALDGIDPRPAPPCGE